MYTYPATKWSGCNVQALCILETQNNGYAGRKDKTWTDHTIIFFYEPKGERCVLTTERASRAFSAAAGDFHVNAWRQVGRNAHSVPVLTAPCEKGKKDGINVFPTVRVSGERETILLHLLGWVKEKKKTNPHNKKSQANKNIPPKQTTNLAVILFNELHCLLQICLTSLIGQTGTC